GWTACRSAVDNFDGVAHSSDPITIPLPFGILPFRVDDVRLGSIDRITLERSEPQVITGIRIQVSLTDSADADQLAGCDLIGENLANFDEHSTFRCQHPDAPDSMPAPGAEAAVPPVAVPGEPGAVPTPEAPVPPATPELRPFGTVLIGDLELTLLLTEADIREFQDHSPESQSFIDEDSLNEAIQRQVDSATSEALDQARRQRELADSIRQARTQPQPET
ncbi:MAG: hypothetical protein ACREL6_08190, partial [Gemmatimonadales bacterium]